MIRLLAAPVPALQHFMTMTIRAVRNSCNWFYTPNKVPRLWHPVLCLSSAFRSSTVAHVAEMTSGTVPAWAETVAGSLLRVQSLLLKMLQTYTTLPTWAETGSRRIPLADAKFPAKNEAKLLLPA
jgi:hypothetical protein